MSTTIQHTPGRPTATLRDVWALLAPVAPQILAGCRATVDTYAESDEDDDAAARSVREGAITVSAHLVPIHGTESTHYDCIARRTVTTKETAGSALLLDGQQGFLWAPHANGEVGTHGTEWSFGPLTPLDHAFIPADYDVRTALRVVAALLRDAIRRNPPLRREAWRLRRITATLRDMDN